MALANNIIKKNVMLNIKSRVGHDRLDDRSILSSLRVLIFLC